MVQVYHDNLGYLNSLSIIEYANKSWDLILVDINIQFTEYVEQVIILSTMTYTNLQWI